MWHWLTQAPCGTGTCFLPRKALRNTTFPNSVPCYFRGGSLKRQFLNTASADWHSTWLATGKQVAVTFKEWPGVSLYHSLLPYLNAALAQDSKETAWLTCFKFATLSHCDGFYKQHIYLFENNGTCSIVRWFSSEGYSSHVRLVFLIVKCSVWSVCRSFHFRSSHKPKGFHNFFALKYYHLSGFMNSDFDHMRDNQELWPQDSKDTVRTKTSGVLVIIWGERPRVATPDLWAEFTV